MIHRISVYFRFCFTFISSPFLYQKIIAFLSFKELPSLGHYKIDGLFFGDRL